jgi:uncharacterized protein (TIGR00299 family) protein
MASTVAILEPFSGISGDMTLGALVAVGLEPSFIEQLPTQLGLDGIGVAVKPVIRAGISCTKVDFTIPPQPHARHLKHIRAIIEKSGAPAAVKEKADATFAALTAVEAQIHGTTIERVHLHEVGAVDAILDVIGAIWGLDDIGVRDVFCGPIQLGEGTVHAAHGEMPVPAPATLKLLEGLPVRSGPAGSGELVTPTGAALVRTLSRGTPPSEFIPTRSGYGAGTRDFPKRPNALRITLAEYESTASERLVELVADIDDMSPEYVAGVSEMLREAGALDVIVTSTLMKRGRPGVRIEVLAGPDSAPRLEGKLFAETSTIGIRRRLVERTFLARTMRSVDVLGHAVTIKEVVLPDGSRRVKPEYIDVQRVALATERPLQDIFRLALTAAERV